MHRSSLNWLRVRSVALPLLALAGVALIFGSAWFSSRTSPPTLAQSTDVSRWVARIRAAGPTCAYQELARAVEKNNPSVQHGAAHAFGDALYATQGINGVATCDARFSYGCYHEFMGKAIVDQGLTIVPLLDNACKDNVGCQHGIGHGVLAYVGYNEDDLKETISLCTALPDDQPIQGCDAGAYMEYNLETMLQEGTSGEHTRMPQHDDLFAPCSHLPQVDARVCYEWQPQWWWVLFNQVQGIEPVPAFAKMVQLCGQLSGASFRAACVEGIGLMAPPAALYDGPKTATLCDTLGSARDRLVCRGYAASVFYTTGFPQQAARVCEGLSGALNAYCQSFATGASFVSRPAQLPI